MAEQDIAQTTQTDITGTETLYSVPTMTTDAATDQKENYWINTNWPQQLGYYKKIPELKKAVDALAMWIGGKGWEADNRTKVILENITGWGEDTFESILNNMIITKKIAGDAFAEIIRNDDGTLINIKVLSPGSMKIVTDKGGVIQRYEQITTRKKFTPEKILHLCNDRIADEIHGVSVIDACEWVVLARNQAMADWKEVLHRNVRPLRIIEVDTDNTTKLAALKVEYQDAINNGEVLIIPKGTTEVKETSPVLTDPQSWIKYLENFFYQAVGIPKVILGGSEEFTEASSKIGYLTFEQVYSKEQRELEADLWNQIAVRVTFNKPASIKNELLQSEDKNTGQVGIQPKETTATMERE